MQTVTQFRSDSGNVFDSEYEAHRDDLRTWLASAAGNDPIARQIAERAATDLDVLAAIVGGMTRTAPAVEPELPMQAHDRALRPVPNQIAETRHWSLDRYGCEAVAP